MRGSRTTTLRKLSVAVIVAGIGAGAFWNLGLGSASGFGVKSIAAICPLGYLETAIAGRTALPRLIVPFLLIVAATIALGRVFCAWGCPIPWVKSWLPRRGAKNGNGKATENGIESMTASDRSSPGLWILGGTLLSSAVFGFPVFCLICPVGLTFATLFAIIRLFRFNEMGLELLVFPAVILLEIVVLRRWCSKLCPLGALLGLISRLNRSLVPTVDRTICLSETRGASCQLCRTSCEHGIDLKAAGKAGRLENCTKCRECADSCPVRAIRFPWWRKN